MYGCSWDSETDESDGFDMYGYDGEDFITLELKNKRYTTPLPQVIPIAEKWTRKLQDEIIPHYLRYECSFFLKYFLNLANGTLNKTGIKSEYSMQIPYQTYNYLCDLCFLNADLFILANIKL